VDDFGLTNRLVTTSNGATVSAGLFRGRFLSCTNSLCTTSTSVTVRSEIVKRVKPNRFGRHILILGAHGTVKQYSSLVPSF
jgi:hypothetical protein